MEILNNKRVKKQEEDQPAAAPANQLPGDLVLEIFSLLPAKSLLRFRCVSKPWRALTSHALKKVPLAMSGLFYDKSHSIRYVSTHNDTDLEGFDISLAFLPSCPGLRMLDCCNGLLLCFRYKAICTVSPVSQKEYFVCNPATKIWAAVPAVPRTRACMYTLDFDHQASSHFRVYAVCPQGSQRHSILVAVFSSETGNWALSEEHHTDLAINEGFMAAVFFNGILHVTGLWHLVIAGIDREGKVCQRIKFPGEYQSLNMTQVRVGQSGGYLHFACTYRNLIDVWVLKEHNNDGWVLKHRVPMGVLMEKKLRMSSPRDLKDGMNTLVMMLLWSTEIKLNRYAFHPDMDVIFLVMEEKLYSYNLTLTELTEVCSSRLPIWMPYSPCYSYDLGGQNLN